MGYMHIENLHANQDILMFKECYALEKIHGTSAHVRFTNGEVGYHSGGVKQGNFTDLFDTEELYTKFMELGYSRVVAYGEAYGGKCQGMSALYGPDLKFVVFEVKVGDTWLNVPNAADVASKLGLEFVHFDLLENHTDVLDRFRDAPSAQSIRNGIEEGGKREGIVLRPIEEMTKSNGNRIIAKHKGAEFSETKTVREVSPERAVVLKDANDIAAEWVTHNRMAHVLDELTVALGFDPTIKDTLAVIQYMQVDIYRESKGEVEATKEVNRAIGSASAKLFKEYLKSALGSRSNDCSE